MSTTTPMVLALESIDASLLSAVSGGCHKAQQTIINNVMPAPAPQVAPPPAPMPAPAAPSVQTSVSINGQPAA